MRKAIYSHTAQHNNYETDLLPEVECLVAVQLDGGKKELVRVMAPDPMEAIAKVDSLDDETYNNLRRSLEDNL